MDRPPHVLFSEPDELQAHTGKFRGYHVQHLTKYGGRVMTFLLKTLLLAVISSLIGLLPALRQLFPDDAAMGKPGTAAATATLTCWASARSRLGGAGANKLRKSAFRGG